MGILAFIVFGEVVMRYVFNSPTIWANEMSTYMLQFMTFFAMGLLLIEDRHVRVTFLIDSLKGTSRKVLEVITRLLVIPYSVILMIYGYQFTLNALQLQSKSPTPLQFPLWIPYSFIAACGVLLLLSVICSIILVILNQQDHLIDRQDHLQEG
jgi:TRAP-type C4-dicarboxylate transport system permease small subunit